MCIGQDEHSIYIANGANMDTARKAVSELVPGDRWHDISIIHYLKGFSLEVDLWMFTDMEVSDLAKEISKRLGVRTLCDWELDDYEAELYARGIDPYDEWFTSDGTTHKT